MSLAYRADVDGLRAVAVGSVVLYHSHIPPFTGGYIGVDVFFVVSGFLITSILYREIKSGSFSLLDFYDRRIRRIFPALFLVLAVTTLLAAHILLPRQMVLYAKSLPPSALFYANIYFEQTLNYFGPKANDTPLLHLWSLAVEEQFYIVFPLLLFALLRFGGRTLAVAAIAVISVASLVYAQFALSDAPSMAFYMPMSRAWELMAGSMLALVAWPRVAPKVAAWVALAGMAAIIVPVFAYNYLTPFPGLAAAPAVLGAVAVIWAGACAPEGVVSRVLSLPGFVTMGRMSYSLYLWHWPLLVLGLVWKGRALTYFESGGVVLFAVLLSALSLKYVETPLRRPQALGGNRAARFGAGAAAILVAVGISAGIAQAGRGFWPISPRGAAAESAADDQSRSQKNCNNMPEGWRPRDLAPIVDCARGSKAAEGRYDAVVWGDSHSGAAFIGFAEELERLGLTTRMMTMPGCPPLLSAARSRGIGPPGACNAFNETVLEEIRQVKPKLVILVARWSLVTRGPALNAALMRGRGGEPPEVEQLFKSLLEGLDTTIEAVTALGARVLLVGQAPEYRYAPNHCFAWKEFYGGDSNACLSQSRADAFFYLADGNALLERAAARHPGTDVFLLSDVFCDKNRCRASEGDDFFYVDGDHLSATGARVFSIDARLRSILTAALAGAVRPGANAQ
ncbi:acyltransferase family protein [Xanthobacter autotrophicus]|uniref:acyltransferase family protein n=1 Tax=Xanthobacter autotrophicus TaxID=280 RepID=UPI00372A9D23